MTKPLTANEWRDSVQQIWDEAIKDSIQDQIREAVLAEREACAKVCDEKAEEWFEMRGWLDDFANEIGSSIRARGQG